MTADIDPAPATPAGAGDDLTYGDALDELEDLLDELEAADVDVDALASRVARGVELIRFCRARLDVVTGDVDAVVAELVALDGGSPGTTNAADVAAADGDDDGRALDDGDDG
ncbi:MAG: exodeoxyribonuclease VII small subunit [Actinomycetota bacterium]